MTALGQFQEAFAQALIAPPGTPAQPAVDNLARQPGFAVYRNTVIKGCIDALQANYPAVARLTGDEWFRAAAAVYVSNTPPDDPSLLYYGASFAAFLAHFEPARELPYLPAVAHLDRLWSEAHTAHDEAALDPTAVVNLDPQQLAAAVLRPHAAARWAWFADAPAFSIWSRNRDSKDIDIGDEIWEPAWQAEGALLTRPHGSVEWRALDAAGFAFLEACAGGATLAQAADITLAAHADAELQPMMQTLLQAGAFGRISIASRRNEQEKS